MSDKNKRRYKNRSLELHDILNNDYPESDYNGILENILKRIGEDYFEGLGASNELKKWESECNELYDSLDIGSNSTILEKLKKFRDRFDHSQERLFQVLHSNKKDDQQLKKSKEELFEFLNLFFRAGLNLLIKYEERNLK